MSFIAFGNAVAFDPSVNGVPGFQSFTSSANVCCGSNQLRPGSTGSIAVRVNVTKTRPVNGSLSTFLSTVIANETGAASWAAAGTTNPTSQTNGVNRRIGLSR